MAISSDQQTDWTTPQPGTGPPDGQSRRGYVIAVIAAVVIFIAVLVGALTLTHHGNTTFPRVTSPATKPSKPGATTPTTTGGAGTAAIPAAQPNPPSLAGAYSTDPVTVLRAISAYSDWLFAHPNPALLANYMLPRCSQYNAVKQQLTLLVNNGWHQRPSVTGIQWAKVNVPFTPAPGRLDGHPAYVGGGVKVVLTDTPQSSDILNAAGQVVTSAHNPALSMLGITFAQGPDGRFRIISEGAANPPGGVPAFES